MNPTLLSGARGLIQRKSSTGDFVTIAVALDITVNVREGVRQTYVMGRYIPAAQDPVTIDVDCTIGRVVPINQADSATDSGKVTAIDLGLEERIDGVLVSESITIAVQDKVTGKYTAAVREARFTGRSLGVNANDTANERLNFVGIYDSGYGDAEQGSVIIGYDKA